MLKLTPHETVTIREHSPDALLVEVGRDGMPSPLAFGAYLTEYSDVFRLGGPQLLLRPATS